MTISWEGEAPLGVWYDGSNVPQRSAATATASSCPRTHAELAGGSCQVTALHNQHRRQPGKAIGAWKHSMMI